MESKEEAIAILAEYRAVVWPVVQGYLQDPEYPREFQVPEEYASEMAKQWEIVREYPERRGKYVRPTLVMLVAEAMGGTRESVAQVAAAMQLSEEWLLIHDDFEDGSTMRRGRPALHRKYGAALAVNAGDTLHVIMWRAIMESRKELGTERSWAIADEFYTALLRTAHGQGVEIAWASSSRENSDSTSDNVGLEERFGVGSEHFTDEDWYFIADGKTAYYTVTLPLRLGAVAAGATAGQLAALTKFGLYLGRCFQLVDDILDVTSDYRGQEAGGDIREGKRTIPLSHFLRHASVPDRQQALRIVAMPADQKSDEEIRWVLAKMREYGSITYGRKVAEELKQQAEEVFANELGFLSKEPARGRLESLMHFVLEREY